MDNGPQIAELAKQGIRTKGNCQRSDLSNPVFALGGKEQEMRYWELCSQKFPGERFLDGLVICDECHVRIVREEMTRMADRVRNIHSSP